MSKLKSILSSLLTGAVSAIPVVGNVAKEIKESRSVRLPHSSIGKVDYAKIAGYSIMFVIILAVIFGKIDIETAGELIKKLNLFSFFS